MVVAPGADKARSSSWVVPTLTFQPLRAPAHQVITPPPRSAPLVSHTFTSTLPTQRHSSALPMQPLSTSAFPTASLLPPSTALASTFPASRVSYPPLQPEVASLSPLPPALHSTSAGIQPFAYSLAYVSKPATVTSQPQAETQAPSALPVQADTASSFPASVIARQPMIANSALTHFPRTTTHLQPLAWSSAALSQPAATSLSYPSPPVPAVPHVAASPSPPAPLVHPEFQSQSLLRNLIVDQIRRNNDLTQQQNQLLLEQLQRLDISSPTLAPPPPTWYPVQSAPPWDPKFPSIDQMHGFPPGPDILAVDAAR